MICLGFKSMCLVMALPSTQAGTAQMRTVTTDLCKVHHPQTILICQMQVASGCAATVNALNTKQEKFSQGLIGVRAMCQDEDGKLSALASEVSKMHRSLTAEPPQGRHRSNHKHVHGKADAAADKHARAGSKQHYVMSADLVRV